MIIDRYGQCLLRLILPYHVLIQIGFDLLRRQKSAIRLLMNLCLFIQFPLNNVRAQINTLITDKHAISSHHSANLILSLSTKGTNDLLSFIRFTGHIFTSIYCLDTI